ncbi:MAG: family 43 glycosylhydrolase [Clostridium sp.]|nr:family 43 glycosylhydrolase [Clostridium sp.]
MKKPFSHHPCLKRALRLLGTAALLLPWGATAQNLRLHYGLSRDVAGARTVTDETGGGHDATLKGTARIASFDGQNVISLGTGSGYADLGESTGDIMASLTDFTIHTRIYIPSSVTLSGNGFFIWTFSNAANISTSPTGYLFLNAQQLRYAITRTNYSAESGISRNKTLSKEGWQAVTLTQKDGLATLYLNGIKVQQGTVGLSPSDVGATACNWLGRSCYSGDKYLGNAQISDFRIYDGAIDEAEIRRLAGIGEKPETVTLKAHYDFTSANDIINGYQGALYGSAQCSTMEGLPVVSLGNADGYVDLGSGLGELIARTDSFTITTNVFIPASAAPAGDGNFLWTFANSDNLASAANGGAFLRATDLRYAITPTLYSAEQGFSATTGVPTGRWVNVTCTRNGNGVMCIYLDGELTGASSIPLSGKALGSTGFNFLGRSCYIGDRYLKGARMHGFRIYDGAMTAEEVKALCGDLPTLERGRMRMEVEQATALVDIPEEVRETFLLPTRENTNGVSISWTSSDEDHLSAQGFVNRPAYGQPDATVRLTATFTKGDITATRDYTVRVKAALSPEESVAIDLESLSLDDTDNLFESVTLPYRTPEGSVVTWRSSAPDYLTDSGRLLRLAARGEGKKAVVLTATATRGESSAQRDFTVYVAEDEGYTNYLFAYFTGNNPDQEQIRFALSTDGYSFTPLNNGNAIIASDTISFKGAVRDPHILRGEDGRTFYMVVTDMKSNEGWDSNDGLVLMKSTDLIHWTHTTIDFPDTWPGRFDRNALTQVWAPQTIYDPEAGRYMVYYSIGERGQHYKLYYSYANDDFTELTEPQLLFDLGSNTIDGDIVMRDGIYHLFYKTEGNGNGIQKATAPSLKGPWTPHNTYLQQTSVAVEGSGVYKLINSNNWILMYDCYTSGYYQFCSSPDLEHFTAVKNTATSGTFTPRHGTVIPITAEETARLVNRWPSSALTAQLTGTAAPAVMTENTDYNHTARTVYLPVRPGTDLTAFDPQFVATAGTVVSPQGACDFTRGTVEYTATNGSQTSVYSVTAAVCGNPVLPGFHADPEVMYSEKTGRFYLYPTNDGYANWGGYSFNAFSSTDLLNWTDEGTILDLSTEQVGWADGNAWAPCIAESKTNDSYAYRFYFSGNTPAGKQIGVAAANHPAGPYVDNGSPIVTASPTGTGQQIDADVFTDPVSGKNYLYWGNGYMAVAELEDDMISLKPGTTQVITPQGGSLGTYAYREGTYVFYRKGLYYFMWSVDDTGADNYHVAYGTATSPTGPITVARNPVVLQQDPSQQIYGTGHNSVIQIPGRDEWYIVYHRINKHYRSNGPGYHREVCIDRMTFDEDGTIQPVVPTHTGIRPVSLSGQPGTGLSTVSSPASLQPVSTTYYDLNGIRMGSDENRLPHGLYLRRTVWDDGTVRCDKFLCR